MHRSFLKTQIGPSDAHTQAQVARPCVARLAYRARAHSRQTVCQSASSDVPDTGPPIEAEKRETKSSQGSQPSTNPYITGAILGPSATTQSKASWHKGYRLARRTAELVWANAWTVLSLFALCDAVIFLLHRFCHRLTNEVALRFLLPANTTPAFVGGNLWYLSNNPDIANFQTGYQWVVGAVFLLMFPISILLRTFAASASQVILSKELERNARHPDWKPPVRGTVSSIKSALKGIAPIVSRLWQVDLLVAVRSIPLQGLSLLLVTLPWTVPRLIRLQLAAPIALFEGEEGDEAIKASGRLIEPERKAVLYPYLGLLIGSKLVAFLGRIILVSLSPRITAEIPELPIAVYILVAVLTLVLSRVQDLLPFVTYSELKAEPGAKSLSLQPAT